MLEQECLRDGPSGPVGGEIKGLYRCVSIFVQTSCCRDDFVPYLIVKITSYQGRFGQATEVAFAMLLAAEWLANAVRSSAQCGELFISRGSGLILVCPCICVHPSWADKTSVLPLFQ